MNPWSPVRARLQKGFPKNNKENKSRTWNFVPFRFPLHFWFFYLFIRHDCIFFYSDRSPIHTRRGQSPCSNSCLGIKSFGLRLWLNHYIWCREYLDRAHHVLYRLAFINTFLFVSEILRSIWVLRLIWKNRFEIFRHFSREEGNAFWRIICHYSN